MNIYVGNLSYQATEQDLKKLFSEFGEVKSVKIINDNYTGRSRGFGFVDMEQTSEATKAIEALNNVNFKQQSLIVNEARSKTPVGGEKDSFFRNKNK